jgi:nanoRNase/pAp phosphatase (c-di-AMP/oligoRNAs hydrolase)
LLKILKNQQLKKVAILGHTSIDPDSIASAFGMACLLKNLNKKIQIDILVNGIGKHTNELLKFYNQPYLTKPEPPYDLIIIVDVNVKSQLGTFQELVLKQDKKDIIIIDHHTPTEFSETIKNRYIQEEKSSTAEMVVDLLFDLNIKPEKSLLTILIAGIIYDSRRFYSMNIELLNIVEKMLKLGGDYDKANNLIQKKLDFSERIARLKCASRMRYFRTSDWLIVWSNIGSHEGTSARGIIELGADVAIIYSKRKKQTRLSARASYNFFKETSINFAKDVMNPIGQKYQGDGGGHSTAAALIIPHSISEEDLMSEVIHILEEKLAGKLAII